MKIFRVILSVVSIEEAAVFYENLLGLAGKRVSPGRHYFDCEGVILACYDPQADGDGFNAMPNPDHVYFATPNLDAVLERAKQLKCRELSGIETQPWGERSFYMKDLSGNPICFVDKDTMFTG